MNKFNNYLHQIRLARKRAHNKAAWGNDSPGRSLSQPMSQQAYDKRIKNATRTIMNQDVNITLEQATVKAVAWAAKKGIHVAVDDRPAKRTAWQEKRAKWKADEEARMASLQALWLEARVTEFEDAGYTPKT